MNDYLKFTLSLARKAGSLLKTGFTLKKDISLKNGRELVTEYDLASEKLIIEAIRREYPGHCIMAEETLTHEISKGYCWIVDPLDGTNNYAHGFPVFAVSLALALDQEIILGVIFDPLRDEMFYTEHGYSFLNGDRIRVGAQKRLMDSLLATGFPYDLTADNENNLDLFMKFSVQALGLRRAGSAALDLAYVAAGRLDGFWELKLKPWDMAAGSLLVKNAGGIISGFNGKDWTIKTDRIVAANPHIHNQMMKIIAS
ncbi:inositol monophosphatase [bacterium]|nr:inositol monophosphatase [bacterium]